MVWGLIWMRNTAVWRMRCLLCVAFRPIFCDWRRSQQLKSRYMSCSSVWPHVSSLQLDVLYIQQSYQFQYDSLHICEPECVRFWPLWLCPTNQDKTMWQASRLLPLSCCCADHHCQHSCLMYDILFHSFHLFSASLNCLGFITNKLLSLVCFLRLFCVFITDTF